MGAAASAAAKGAAELAVGGRLQAFAEAAVPGEEGAALGGEAGAAAPAAGRRLEEADPGGALEVAEVPPAVPVRHPDPIDGAAERAKAIDELEQPRPSLA